MTVTLELSDDALARLQAEAARRGVSIDALAARLPQRSSPSGRRELGTVGLGASEADEMLAEGFGQS